MVSGPNLSEFGPNRDSTAVAVPTRSERPLPQKRNDPRRRATATSRMEGTATPQNAEIAQLAHRDALRVEVVNIHLFVFDALYLIILEHR